MDKLIISGQGFPGTNQYLAFSEKSSHDQISALVKAVGNNCIINGMELNGSNLTDGWLIYNNELLPFESSAIGSTIVIVETVSTGGYDVDNTGDFSTILPIWKKRKAKFGNPSDADVVSSFAYSLLTRVNSNQDLTSLKLTGQVRLITPPTGASSIVITGGDFTAASFTLLSGFLYNITLAFPEVFGDFHVLFTFQSQNASSYGYSSLALVNKSSTSINFNLDANRGVSLSPDHDLRINVILIG